MTKSVAFYTLGCKVNQYESERMESAFMDAGYEIKTHGEPADVYVVNTCTVTRLAERKSRQFMRRAKRQNPSAIVAAVGCYPKINPDEVQGIEEVDIVLDNEHKHQIVELVEACMKNRQMQMAGLAGGLPCDDFQQETMRQAEHRTRSMIKIQDGCDRFCSYCVIPYARGAVHSRPVADIEKEALELVGHGARELVLTGINTALYGKDFGTESDGIIDVVSRLNRIPGDFRIRLGSLEPTVVDAAYVERLLEFEKLCHHLHLSLQSGSDRILKEMRRRYTVEEYMDIVRTVRRHDPHYAITTDVIAGFPGESDSDFQETVDVIKAAGFLKVHAFPYSKRPLTDAASALEQVPSQVKKQRVKLLSEVADSASQAYIESLSGLALRVLPEEIAERRPGGIIWKGREDRYVAVYATSPNDDMPDGFQTITAGNSYADGLFERQEEIE